MHATGQKYVRQDLCCSLRSDILISISFIGYLYSSTRTYAYSFVTAGKPYKPRMTCGFMALSTVFKLYRADGRLYAMEARLQVERFPSSA